MRPDQPVTDDYINAHFAQAISCEDHDGNSVGDGYGGYGLDRLGGGFGAGLGSTFSDNAFEGFAELLNA